MSDPIVLATVVAGTWSGAAIDLRTRRVPNALTGALAASGVALAAAGLSGLSVPASLSGLALGLVVMLPGRIFGATGSGDVKLMAAVGALLGPSRVIQAFLGTALAGGVIALAIALHRRRLRRTLGSAARVLAHGAPAADDIERPDAGNRFAYAPAIAIGALAAALGW